jgi:hypothetical protein
LEVRRGKSDSRQPGTEKIKSTTEVEFTVSSSKNSLKECSWNYGPTKIIGVNPDQIDDQTKKLVNTYEGLEVKLAIDKSGIIQELTNFDECKQHIENSFRVIYNSSPNRLSDDEIAKMMNAIKPTYATPEIFLQTYCPEIGLFFTLFGETINVGSVRVTHSELPNPFGGRSFPAEVSTKVDGIEQDIATISVRQTIPEKDLTVIMRETMVELSKLSSKPFSDNEIPKMNVTTISIFKYDYKRNELIEVNSKKDIEADIVKQTQTLQVLMKN